MNWKAALRRKPSFIYRRTSNTSTRFRLDREVGSRLASYTVSVHLTLILSLRFVRLVYGKASQSSSLEDDFFFFLPFFFGGGGGAASSTSSAVLTCGAPSMFTFGFSILRHTLSG
jgi:hypothetical protein